MLKVSIVMPVYNMERFISQALDSVLAQTYKNYELIIIDDGSSDDSKRIIKKYIKNFENSVSIIYLYQKNQGVACARNTGIRSSSGEYIALLDPDDVWLPNRLLEGVKVLDMNPTVGLVHANIIYIDEVGSQTGVPLRNAFLLSGNIYKNILLRKGHISCSTVLFRRSCLDEIGLFDEHLTYLGCEDRDLWLRIAAKYQFYYIAKELAYYRRVVGSMSSNFEKMLQGRYYVVDKNSRSLLRRKGHAAIHEEIADILAYKREYGRALKDYLISLIYWPFRLRVVSGLVKTFLRLIAQ